MSIIPQIKSRKDHYKGSTLLPLNIKFNFDITGATITCTVRAVQGSSIIYEWKTGINITIVNLVTGEIILNQIDEFNPAVGNYIHSINIKFANGTSEPYAKLNQKVVL